MEQPDQFQVEIILADRTIPRGNRLITQYKVKWKGYPASQSTWEPLENLQNCLHLLQAYQEKLKKRSEPKPLKISGNPKKPATKEKANESREVLPKEPSRRSSNDFYFEDEDDNEIFNINQSQPPRMEVEPMQDQAPLNTSTVVIKLQNKVKETTTEEIEVKVPNKRGRKKKKNQENPNGGSFDQLNITYEQLGQRAVQEQLNYEPAKRIMKVNNEIEEKWNSFTQTEPLPNTITDMEAITMHSSYEYPGKIWFTVREFGKLMEMTRQTLLEAYPRVLYAYYHKHYLRAKQRSFELMRETQQMTEKQQAHSFQEQSNQKSFSVELSSESISSSGSEDSNDYIYISEVYKKERVSQKRWKKELKKRVAASSELEVSEEGQNENDVE